MNKWLWKLITLVLVQASPQIREHLCSLLTDLAKTAAKTENGWDDVLVDMLQTLLACPEK